DDGTVSRVDPKTARITRTIPIGPPVSGITASAHAVWVLGLDGAVRRIDPLFNRVVATIKVGRFDLAANSLPPIAATGDTVIVGGTQIVPAAAVSALYRIDARTNKLTLLRRGIDPPTQLAVFRGSVWASSDLADVVSRVDLTDRHVTAIRVGPQPTALAVGLGGVWVGTSGSGAVAKIDPVSNDVVATVPTGRQPAAVAVAGRQVWAGSTDGTLSAIDPFRDRVDRSIDLRNEPSTLLLSHGRLWTTLSRPSESITIRKAA